MPSRRRVLALASLLAACSAPGSAPPSLPLRPPPAPPQVARWLPMDVAPGDADAPIVLARDSVALRLDRGDVRWLVKRGEPPRRAPSADPARPVVMGFALGGLLAVDDARRLRFAREPLGAWEELGALPEGAKLGSLAVYRDGMTVEIDGVPSVFSSLSGLARGEAAPPGGWLSAHNGVAPIEGRRATDARIGADGAGLALFSPQMIAATSDGGRTFTRLDDRGLFISELITDGDRVVLSPGGGHDVFARAWTPGAATLARTPVPATSHGDLATPRKLAAPQVVDALDRRKQAIASGERVRGALAAAIEEHRAIVDGDEIVFFPGNGSLGIGALGGGVAWSNIAGFEDLCGKTSADAFTAHGGAIAFRCRGVVHVLRPDRGAVHIPFDGSISALSLEASGQLLVIGGTIDAERKQIDTVVYRINLERPKRHEVVARSPDTWPPDLVYRRGDDPDAPIWAAQARAGRILFRIDPRIGTIARITLPEEAPPDLKPAGFTAEGGLVMRSPAALHRLVVVTPSGELEMRDTPLAEGATDDARKRRGDEPWGTFAINDEGRGLAVDDGRHAWQTTDAGRTWQPAAPPGPNAIGSRLVCGRSRCELEDVAVRAGWDEAVPEARPGEPAPDPAPPSPSRAARFTCTKDDARRPRLDPAHQGTPGEIVFGAGDHLWSSYGIVSRPLPARPGTGLDDVVPAEQEIFVLHGEDDGSVSARSLARRRIDRATGEAGGGVHLVPGHALGVVWAETDRGVGKFTEIVPLRLAADTGTGAPRRAKVDLGVTSYPFFGSEAAMPLGRGQNLFSAPEGLAIEDDLKRRLYWVHASGAVDVRDWPGESADRSRWAPYSGPEIEGTLARAADGRWLAAHLDGERALRLVLIEADGLARAETMLFHASDGERGVGVLADGDAFFVALVEPLGDGTAELRLRPVDADLRLGAPLTLGRAARGALISLPSCGPGAPSAVLRLHGPHGAAVELGGAELRAPLVREVRFDRSRACVARTQVGEGSDFVAMMRGAGDGPALVRTKSGAWIGATCQPR